MHATTIMDIGTTCELIVEERPFEFEVFSEIVRVEVEVACLEVVVKLGVG